MSSRSFLLAVFALAVATVLVALLAGPRADPDPPMARKTVDARVEPEPPLSTVSATSQREEAIAPLSSATSSPAAPAAAFEPRPMTSVRVEVREADGTSVPGAALRLAPAAGPHVHGLDVPEDRGSPWFVDTDSKGAARFDDVPSGPYEIGAWKDRRREIRNIVVTPGTNTVELTLGDAPADLVVRVVEEGGAPVAGARVEIHGELGFGAGASAPRVDEGGSYGSRTDERGLVRFPGIDFAGGVLFATAKDGRAGKTAVRQREGVERAMRSGGIVVTVAATGGIEGELRGLPPERLATARVIAYALDNANPYYTTHGRGHSSRATSGRYRFDGLAAGTWSLSLDDPGGARLLLPPLRDFGGLGNSVDPIEVEVASGRTTTQDLEVADGGVIEGVVRRSDGTPVHRAEVLDTFAPSTSNFPDGFVLHGANVWRFDAREPTRADHPETHPRTRTDAQGRYRLAGLQPGRHRIEVIVSGLSYDRLEGVAVADGVTISLDHVLESAGAIQGVNPLAGYVGVTREGERDPRMIAVLPGDGRFTFAGLAAGRYSLSQFHSDASVAPVLLREVVVEAGRTTWVDLSAAERPVRIGGRVIGAHGPIEGARVRMHPQMLVTDAAGHFETHASFALTMWVTMQVRVDGIETAFKFPGMEKGEIEWDEDLVLGRESLVVRTVDERGAPARARIDVSSTQLAADGPIQSANGSAIDVDESGERTLAGLPAGTFDVKARFANWAEAQVSVRLPTAEPVVVRAPEIANLVVLARLAGGDPAPGRAVRARTTIEGGSEPRYAFKWAETDAVGRATLRGVTAGDVLVDVRLARGGFGGDDGVLASEQVRLAPGEQRTISFVVERR